MRGVAHAVPARMRLRGPPAEIADRRGGIGDAEEPVDPVHGYTADKERG